mmetsp:Transcript_34360/g.77425  ORF Transcript_34360/g.77425 Transcript_34360/m.77425 type:complete len:221 (+) Transcript_34360:48-710(+)
MSLAYTNDGMPRLDLVEDQASVGSSKPEAVGENSRHLSVVPLAEDVEALGLVAQVLDVCRLRQEAVVEHEQRVDRLLHSRSTERVPGERLGGSNHRAVAAGSVLDKGPLDGLKLHGIADRSGSAVGVDVVDLARSVGRLVRHCHGNLHALLSSEAGRRNHVVAIGVGSIPHQLSIDLRSSCLGSLVVLEDQDASSSSNHKPVARLVEGTGSSLGAVIVLG